MEIGINVLHVLRGLLGITVLLGIAYLLSNNKKQIDWKMVGKGILLQLIIAISILYIPVVQSFFVFIGKLFVSVYDCANSGISFLIGSFIKDREILPANMNFAFTVLPIIIFFSALANIFYYFGIIPKVVCAFGKLLQKILGTNGAESLSVAGNIFLGQTEAPLMIKAYLPKMNHSEMLLIMAGGMATLAGSVMALYIKMLGGESTESQQLFATQLLTASVMAAPAVIIFAKIIIPQTRKNEDCVTIPRSAAGNNFLDVIANGTTDGLKLAINVGAMLLVFISLTTFGNKILHLLGDNTNLNAWINNSSNGQYTALSFEYIFGQLFSPLMWLIGVESKDLLYMGQLLGEKIAINELIAYSSLSELKSVGAISSRSIFMATFFLCGFANISSIGIQIGGISILAPNHRKMITELGLKAMIAGALASLSSATIIGSILL